jgi:ABC-type nitrate/sulfonate/bicarbonate transport system substrate-binding protein
MSSRYMLNRRRLLGFGASAVSVGLLSKAPVSPASAAAADDISFQFSWIKSAQYGGYFVGLEHGIFQQHGIAPTFNSGGPNVDPIGNVASGQSNMGDRPIGPLLIARDKGIPIKVIGTVFARSPFCIISLASNPIRRIQDLAGKSIAVPTSTRPLVLYVLKSAGIDPTSVTFLPSSPDPAALANRQVDALAGYSTNQGVMLQTRGVDIFTINVQDLGLPETTGTIYAREDFLAKNRDAVVRFLKAASESWRYGLDHPEETAKLMVEKYGAPGLDYNAQLAEVKASKPFIEAGPRGASSLLALDLTLFERIINVYRQVDMIKTNMKVEDICDPSFIDAALKT